MKAEQQHTKEPRSPEQQGAADSGEQYRLGSLAIAANAQVRLLRLLADAVAKDLIDRPPKHE